MERYPYSRLYPITNCTLDSLRRHGNLARTLGEFSSERDGRHIVRLLNNTHYPQVESFLNFLNSAVHRWPKVVERVLSQTSEMEFRQNVTELRLLHHILTESACAAGFPDIPRHIKQYDLDVEGGGMCGRIEVYTPVDLKGLQVFLDEVLHLFKYLDVPSGFSIDLRLTASTFGDVGWPISIGTPAQIISWLGEIQYVAAAWLSTSAPPESSKIWLGPNGNAQLVATVRERFSDASVRQVRLDSGYSVDSRFRFDHGDPSTIRTSRWGRNLLKKMAERQCGNPDANMVRALVLNFSELFTSFPEFFRSQELGIFDRLKAAVELIANEIGSPTPYDAVVLARISPTFLFDAPTFAPPIILGEENLSAAMSLFHAIGLSGATVDRF